LRFLLNLNSSGWGCAAEGEALSCSIHHSSVFLRPCRWRCFLAILLTLKGRVWAARGERKALDDIFLFCVRCW